MEIWKGSRAREREIVGWKRGRRGTTKNKRERGKEERKNEQESSRERRKRG